jgi:hypothetical protein
MAWLQLSVSQKGSGWILSLMLLASLISSICMQQQHSDRTCTAQMSAVQHAAQCATAGAVHCSPASRGQLHPSMPAADMCCKHCTPAVALIAASGSIAALNLLKQAPGMQPAAAGAALQLHSASLKHQSSTVLSSCKAASVRLAAQHRQCPASLHQHHHILTGSLQQRCSALSCKAAAAGRTSMLPLS